MSRLLCLVNPFTQSSPKLALWPSFESAGKGSTHFHTALKLVFLRILLKTLLVAIMWLRVHLCKHDTVVYIHPHIDKFSHSEITDIWYRQTVWFNDKCGKKIILKWLVPLFCKEIREILEGLHQLVPLSQLVLPVNQRVTLPMSSWHRF